MKKLIVFIIFGLFVILALIAGWQLFHVANAPITQTEAIQLAEEYMKEFAPAVETQNPDIVETENEWRISYFISPYQRPADVTLIIDKSTGDISVAPRR